MTAPEFSFITFHKICGGIREVGGDADDPERAERITSDPPRGCITERRTVVEIRRLAAGQWCRCRADQRPPLDPVVEIRGLPTPGAKLNALAQMVTTATTKKHRKDIATAILLVASEVTP